MDQATINKGERKIFQAAKADLETALQARNLPDVVFHRNELQAILLHTKQVSLKRQCVELLGPES